MATTVRIVITATAARAVAAFTAVNAAIRRLASQAQSAGQAIGKAAPFALLAGKILLVSSAALLATGTLANLLGAVQLLAPAAAAGGLALLGVKLAMNGVQEALDAGLSGDTEAFNKALAKLAPQAASTVRVLVKLRNAWRPLAKDFQGRVFEGAAGELEGLNKYIKPIADRWLPRLAMRFAEVRNRIADGIARYAADGRLEAVWINITDAVGKLLNVVPALGRAFGDVLEVAAPGFNELAGGIENAAKKFSDWVRGKRDDGSLKRWLDQAMEALGSLSRIAQNVGGIIGAIFKGSNEEGQTFLEKLERITQKMEDWFNSSDGQKLVESIASIVTWLIACEPAFSFLANLMSSRLGELSSLWDGLKGIASGVINYILSAYAWLLDGAAKAFSWIPGLGPKLESAAAAFRRWRDQANEAINGIKTVVDITVNYRARMIGNHLVSGAQQSSTYSSGIGGRASGGMASGLTWVGERGAELVDFSQGRVHSAGQSARMAAGGGSGGTQVVVNFGTPAPGDHLANATLGELRAGRLPLQVTVAGKTYRVKPA